MGKTYSNFCHPVDLPRSQLDFCMSNCSHGFSDSPKVSQYLPKPGILLSRLCVCFFDHFTAINKTEPKNLEDYNLIWGRNLFGTIENRAYTGREIRSVSTSPVPKDFSLRLIGTVVNKIPGVSIAVIVDKSNLSQGLYHEGDKTAGLKIKKIMRNGVIIAAESEDLQLAMESSGSDLIAATSKPNQSHLQEVVKQGHKTTVDDYRLRIKEVQTRLANFEQGYATDTTLPYFGWQQHCRSINPRYCIQQSLSRIGFAKR